MPNRCSPIVGIASAAALIAGLEAHGVRADARHANRVRLGGRQGGLARH